MELSFTLKHLEAHVFRVPIDEPVVTSFGTMRDRPALFVRAISSEGDVGWGEVWCNFPSVGAEHRARLVNHVLAPSCLGRAFADPANAWRHLSSATEVLAIQSGEPGPLAQSIAGIDIAIWDMVARRCGLPLYRLFRDENVEGVPVYASGINASAPVALALEKQQEGYRRFKLKVGFGKDRDVGNLRAMREALGADRAIMVDANQAWSLDEAREMADALAPFAPLWLEEPMRADQPPAVWRKMAKGSPIPIALGENLRGEAEFSEMMAESGASFLQPDIGKWGGFSGCVPVGRQALERGLVFCPHWLGGGVGLVASLHLLAAVGGSGVLEVDANPNVLRDVFVQNYPTVTASGDMNVPSGPGLGVQPDMEAMARYRVEL